MIRIISVSFYQTWLGLEQIFGDASIVISLALSLLLLFLCWLIRDAKLKGKSASKLMWIYIFIASFCFMANFNALYTRFMKTDMYLEELKLTKTSFDNLESDYLAKLINSRGDDIQRLSKIQSEKKKLMSQIIDESNQGIGKRAEEIIRVLESLLGSKLTRFNVTGTDYHDLAYRMGKQIDDVAYQYLPVEEALISDLNSANLKWTKDIETTMALDKDKFNQVAQNKIEKSENEYNKLGNRAQLILGENVLKFPPKKSETHLIGKIGYAFEHAIKNFGIFQIVILMGCILLDFIIPIILILVTEPDDNPNQGGGVFGRNQATTLT